MSNHQRSQNEQIAAHQLLLRERLTPFLQELHPSLRVDVTRALTEPGKLLAQDASDTSSQIRPAGVWALLTLLVALQVDTDIDPFCASGVALAIECFICALDLLDDVEDEDQTAIVRALGAARTLNVSTTLLMLTQRLLLSLLQHNAPPTLILSLVDTLQEAALRATAGQHRDLLAEQRAASDMTQEECIEIAAGKGGALMELTCRLGALCAAADQQLCELFVQMGLLLGIAHQLDNDSHDLYDLLQLPDSATIGVEQERVTGSIKTDILRDKKTLPVVLAAQSSSSLLAEQKDEAGHKQALHEGIIATWGISLLYRERANSCLQQIEAHRPVTAPLRLLLGFT